MGPYIHPIHEQPFSFPQHCAIRDIKTLASTAQTIGLINHKFPAKRSHELICYTCCVGLSSCVEGLHLITSFVWATKLTLGRSTSPQ